MGTLSLTVCFRLLLLWISLELVLSTKEFSLARFSTTSFANNSVIDFNLVGEGFEGSQITDGGALECHTDDTTCCRGRDNPNGGGRGEWYDPDGKAVAAPGGGTVFYRTRDHMVLRLNRGPGTFVSGVYRCVIPGAGGVTITRYITLENGVTCSDLHDVTNGEVTYTPHRSVSSATLPAGKRYTGTIATYSCSSGYQLVGGSSLRACGPDGNWNGTEPTCEVNAGTCDELSSPENGQVQTSTQIMEGTVATYSCDTGYNLIGSSSRTCGANENWSIIAPTCQVVDCGVLAPPDNGQVVTSSGTTYNRQATYSCNVGYNLRGPLTSVCGFSGMWSPMESTCEPVDCGPLTVPTNGQVDTSSGTTFENTATYTCNTGYTLSGSSSRTCGSDGMWSLSEPTCEPVDCGPLTDPTNGQVDTSSGTTFESTATYTCITGYTLSGSSSRTCGANGMWTSSQPECELVIIQIRLGKINNCIDYSTTDSLQKIEDISSSITENVMRLCSCSFNSSFLSNSQLQCFEESPQIVTFRTQLSETSQTSTVELVSYIEQWIDSSEQLVVNGVRLTFDTSCSLEITSFNSEECPSQSSPPSSVGGIVGGIIGALLFVTVVVVMVTTVVIFLYIKRRQSDKKTETELQQTGQTVRNSDTDQAYEVVDSPAVPVEYEEVDKFHETRGNSEMIEQTHKGDYEYTECPAYNQVNRR